MDLVLEDQAQFHATRRYPARGHLYILRNTNPVRSDETRALAEIRRRSRMARLLICFSSPAGIEPIAPDMLLLAKQPQDAIFGIGFLALLFSGIWAFRYTDKMWLRRGIDTTFEGFLINHQSTTVMLRGMLAMLVAYVSVIGPVALIPALCTELFGEKSSATGMTIGLVWLGFMITIGKAWVFPVVRKIFFIPPCESTPHASERDNAIVQADKRIL